MVLPLTLNLCVVADEEEEDEEEESEEEGSDLVLPSLAADDKELMAPAAKQPRTSLNLHILSQGPGGEAP